MSSSLLELIRFNHESAEALETVIGLELEQKPAGQKAKVDQQHRVKILVSKLVSVNEELLKLYEDKDFSLKDELSSMRGPQMFGSFYEALGSTREYYYKFPNTQINSAAVKPSSLEVNVPFSGEEIFGKYLDLNANFLEFANITKKIFTDQDYLQYLDRFNTFFYIPDDLRASKPYGDYLVNLWGYLSNFFRRVHPLIDLDEIVQGEWETEFCNKVRAGEVKHARLPASARNAQSAAQLQPLRLGMFNDSKELEALGMDRLKEGLEALGLKCGGTLQDRAKRLWAVRGKKEADFPANLKAKPLKRKLEEQEDGETDAGQTGGTSRPSSETQKIISMNHVPWLEFKISSLCESLMETVTLTRRHADKQQARSAEEKEAEIAEEEFGLLPEVPDEAAAMDDDDDAPVYNPLNIPLGWDGKPIPYWLYKLHGLGIEYKCEVCGNQSYWGRRAFDKHFQEWKHAHGMRCLGVPNTKHFHDITTIADVMALYSKIKDTLTQEQFSGTLEEEFEDTEGNILNRRTYEDLARQGLL